MSIVVEFLGGPRDGERLSGCLDAGAFYRHTDGGRIGKRFWCPCEYSLAALRTFPLEQTEAYEAAGYRFSGHIYEVVLRREQRRKLVVRARHVGASE